MPLDRRARLERAIRNVVLQFIADLEELERRVLAGEDRAAVLADLQAREDVRLADVRRRVAEREAEAAVARAAENHAAMRWLASANIPRSD